MRTLVACLAILAISTPIPTSAQSPPRPEILILGTFHMANPGRDVQNIEADDVLSDRRQREIAELVDVLESFRPTKIAVEVDVTSGWIPERYADYLAGDYSLGRSETYQIGFRLAGKLGHETVHPVDEDGEFPYYRVQHYAKANGLEEEFDSLGAEVGARVKRAERYLSSHTVLETLEHMNADSTVAEAVGSYYGWVPFGKPYAYAGPDLVAAWFKRNIRIYHNIRALATSPDDRILVVYGAGHLGWLRQMVEDDPSVRLRKLSELME